VKLTTFAAACVIVLAGEAYFMFFAGDSAFRIEGQDQYLVEQFADRATVTHAFQMRGDGLNGVSVRFNSTAAAAVRVQWLLRRGHPDVPGGVTPAFEGIETFNVRAGPQWKTFTFTRDASSRDRWYHLELRLLDIDRGAAALAAGNAPFVISLFASRDNPERGGVLWVGGARQLGSLVMRAERRGRTPYRRFHNEAEPHLPAVLRNGAVQWLVVIGFHWALVVFAWSVLGDARRPSTVAEP
jgi:hypothetical protein